MKKETINISYVKYADINEVNAQHHNLIQSSKAASLKAYAPYSNFQVGASVLLNTGEIVSGTNVENASYPVGVCAERNVLAYTLSNYTNQKIVAMSIFVPVNGSPVPPCGMCRQFILEVEKLQASHLKIYLVNKQSEIIEIESAKDLLPLAFDSDFLK